MATIAGRKSQAIDAAKDLFWRQGYAETSMAEIVHATGMNRYTLYSVFGNKREIFLAALQAYFQEGRAKFEPLIRDTSVAPLDRIRNCLNTFADLMKQQPNGCFICHVAVEHRSLDPTVKAAVISYFDKIRELIEIPLRDALSNGTLNPSLSPEIAAQIVFDAKMSMGVHARAGAGPATMSKIIAATLTALSAPSSAASNQARG